MRILISNDDGYQAKGIQQLAESLSEIADIIIVAPNENKSAASSSLTIGKPLEPIQIKDNIFSIDASKEIDEISLKERNSYNKIVSFDQDLIDSLKKEPEELTTWNIIKQIQFLSDNKLRSGIFEVELYKRLIKPITLVAMILLAMLFVFGSTREVTLGRKIFFGVSLGLSFEMLSRIGGAMALSLDFDPLMSTVLPTIVVIVIAITLLIRKSVS